MPVLDEDTNGKFSLRVRDGWVTATEGNVIDYEAVYAEIESDNNQFTITDVTYDR